MHVLIFYSNFAVKKQWKTVNSNSIFKKFQFSIQDSNSIESIRKWEIHELLKNLILSFSVKHDCVYSRF